ncbi:hypothetical protein Ahy_B08g092409 [Arachis hypogaea]|uniref:Ubiquitin-like protease family profile domain-containing protein n=1 Tax=Arachis hypogaea TaxID=3818 RepID=A0A444Y3W3_ARAHY|nr:hypothetical protein Ahy_B08g092409 [Arachis hypogaea]
MIEDYKIFIPFLDLKKLASHPYIFAPVCYTEHWWIWVADVRKKNFFILDSYHKKCPSESRMKLNKFVVSYFYCLGYVISRMRVYAEGAPLKKDDHEIESYTSTFQAKKYTMIVLFMRRWTTFGYASQILFYEMNRDRDTAIRESEAIRLSKPSAVLLSPYCQIELDDIDSD